MRQGRRDNSVLNQEGQDPMTDKPASEPQDAGSKRSAGRKNRAGLRERRRPLVSTAALPALFTILNGLAGFA